jgi:protoheme IX farnesyltransferase
MSNDSSPAPQHSFYKDLSILFKVRLSSLVIISAVTGYAMGADHWDVQAFICLVVGGILLTGGSNGMNQVWEIELDKLMHRTMNRPLPQDRMTLRMATGLSLAASITGVILLWGGINLGCGVLGIAAFVLYAFVYTPMKRISALSVFVGAIPGAIPPMIGYVAATGKFGLEAGLLFAIQFMWQFPHFWSIAWVLHEDYARAEYKLLPFEEGRSKRSAFQIFMYSLFLIPVGMLPWVMPFGSPMIGNWAMWTGVLSGLVMSFFALRLYQRCDVASARQLMFASFFYLPVVQIVYVINSI